ACCFGQAVRTKAACGAAFALLPFCVLPSCVFERLRLLQTNHTKRSSQIVVRTGGEEELVGAAVVCRTSAEFNSPQLVDADRLAIGVLQRAYKLAGDGIEGVDGAGVGVVRDQQSVAQLSKIPGRDGKAPGLVQWLALRELPHECPVFLEDVDVAA